MGDEALETAAEETFVIDSNVGAEQSTEQSTETAEGTATEPEKVEFNEAQQKVFDTAIAKQGLQSKKSQLKSQAEMDQLQQQVVNLQSQLPQSIRPNIPELPDQYDENFTEKMATRETAIQEAATFDANLNAATQLQNEQALALQGQQQQAANDLATSFVGKAKDLGVSEAELGTALETVGAYGGVGQDLANFVMSHDQGPLVAKYLAENPAEVLTIQTMTPMQGAAHLMTNVMPKAVATKTTLGAPAPVDSLDGNGATPSDEGPAGAKYE